MKARKSPPNHRTKDIPKRVEEEFDNTEFAFGRRISPMNASTAPRRKKGFLRPRAFQVLSLK
jgi:hypothetical protein